MNYRPHPYCSVGSQSYIGREFNFRLMNRKASSLHNLHMVFKNTLSLYIVFLSPVALQFNALLHHLQHFVCIICTATVDSPCNDTYIDGHRRSAMSDSYINSIENELRKLMAKRQKLEEELKQIAGQVAGIQQAAQLFFEHSGEDIPLSFQQVGVTPKLEKKRGNSGWETVLEILMAAPNGLTSSEIVDRARLQNLDLNPPTVRSQLSRAKGKGEEVRLADGKYYYINKKDADLAPPQPSETKQLPHAHDFGDSDDDGGIPF